MAVSPDTVETHSFPIKPRAERTLAHTPPTTKENIQTYKPNPIRRSDPLSASEISAHRVDAKRDDFPITKSDEVKRFLQNTMYARHVVQAREPAQTFENLSRASFIIKQDSDTWFIARVYKFKQDIKDIYEMMYADQPSWHPRLRSRPVVRNNIIIVEEEWVSEMHCGVTLVDWLKRTRRSSADDVLSLCLSIIEVARYFEEKNVLFLDESLSNLRMRTDAYIVCPEYLSNSIVLSNADERVHWSQLRLRGITSPETHYIEQCARMSVPPNIYVQPEPIGMFQLGLVIAQIVFQDGSIDARIVSCFENVTMAMFDEMAQSDDDPYRKEIEGCLRTEIDRSPLVFSENFAGALLDFFLDILGRIGKNVKDCRRACEMEVARMDDMGELSVRLNQLGLAYLGEIQFGLHDHPEEQVKELLSRTYKYTNIEKISNSERTLGRNKCCVAYRCEEKMLEEPDTSRGCVVRVFDQWYAVRTHHVREIYEKIRLEQQRGNELAMKYFPRVLGIDAFVNVLVIREELVDGVDLFGEAETLQRTQASYSNEELKVRQLRLVEQLFSVGSLLHEWNFVHGDLSLCNFMYSSTGDLKMIDLESAVSLGESGDGWYDYDSLRMGDKKNYRCPEVKCYLDNNRPKHTVPIRMRLKQIDVYAIGVVALEILTLSAVRRDGEWLSSVRGCLARAYRGTDLEALASMFEPVFQDFVERWNDDYAAWLLESHRPGLHDLVPGIRELLKEWACRLDKLETDSASAT